MRVITFILASIFSSNSFAQNVIVGTVYNKYRDVQQMATVTALSLDGRSPKIQSTVSWDSGQYKFSTVQGKYVVFAGAMFCDINYTKYDISQGSTLNITINSYAHGDDLCYITGRGYANCWDGTTLYADKIKSNISIFRLLNRGLLDGVILPNECYAASFFVNGRRLRGNILKVIKALERIPANSVDEFYYLSSDESKYRGGEVRITLK